MTLLSFLFPIKLKSAKIAKERLQIIIAREHCNDQLQGHRFFLALHKELIEVISKYIKIHPNDVKISLDRQGNLEVLDVNIILSNNKIV